MEFSTLDGTGLKDLRVYFFPMSLNIDDGDEVVACVACVAGDGPCLVCGQIPYRLICIRRKHNEQENVFLCGKHYLEMLNLRPDLSGLEKPSRK
jgi:hypothetical protein